MNVTIANLTLRSLQADDSPQLLSLIARNRQRLLDYFPVTSTAVTTLSAAYKFVDDKLAAERRREHFTFVLEDAEQQLQGLFFLKNIDWRIPKAELAYFIDAELCGRGIMTEALGAVCRHCFSAMGFIKLFIITSVDNIPSRRIAEKNGFEAEGVLRKNFRINSGVLVDNVYYGKLNTALL